jgi:5,10-methenyltetrahydrofolate synthetase
MDKPVACEPILVWRKAERRRLIQERLAISPEDRKKYAARIAESMLRFVGSLAGHTISFYWPLQGEPDLRPWLENLPEAGGQACLPLVVTKGAPLIFRKWRRGERLVSGVWNIPIPADGAEVVPDIVIAPLVGYDQACYRLGYGGGYFDRTLAALSPRPHVIGVGYAQAAIASINPLWHDVPMDVIVTERGITRPSPVRGTLT